MWTLTAVPHFENQRRCDTAAGALPSLPASPPHDIGYLRQLQSQTTPVSLPAGRGVQWVHALDPARSDPLPGRR